MKLTTLEKLVLRIVAQDEDYERLDLVLSEIKQHLPSASDDKALAAAQQTLRSLISQGLVELYQRNRAEAAKYDAVPKADYDRTLDARSSWSCTSKTVREVACAPTKEGQRVYETACEIPR
jgi:hypothetical protein